VTPSGLVKSTLATRDRLDAGRAFVELYDPSGYVNG
jgi:hypothetical protein